LLKHAVKFLHSINQSITRQVAQEYLHNVYHNM